MIKAGIVGCTKRIKGRNKSSDRAITGASQGMVPVLESKYGLLHTESGDWIKILEIRPVNFYQKNDYEKNMISESFSNFFRICPRRIQFLVLSDSADPEELIHNIYSRNPAEDQSESFRIQLEDYIGKIREISERHAVRERFFLIYPYEGTKSEPKEIYQEMYQVKCTIQNMLLRCGNTLVENSGNYIDENISQQKILYYFYNRRNLRKEGYEKRVRRIIDDMHKCGKGNTAVDLTKDLAAPKGIDMTGKDYILSDGSYQTYLTLTDRGHPIHAYAGWLDIFTRFGEFVDISVHINRLPKAAILPAIEQSTRLKRVTAKGKISNPEKYDEISGQVSNNSYVAAKMREEEDLFEVLLIITIHAPTRKELQFRKNLIRKQLDSRRIDTEEAWCNCETYFKMAAPVLYEDAVIKARNKRNYLTSSLGSLYMFTARELYDPQGYLLGVNAVDSTLVAINNFNSELYKNGNILITGKTGTGKTCTEQVIGYGMRLIGIRVIFILPDKGMEYRPGCENIGGEYVKLGPGTSSCLNIMDIANVDSLVSWIRLLMSTNGSTLTLTEANNLNQIVFDIYKKYKIMDDKGRIVGTASQRKNRMPVLGDLYEELSAHNDMERVQSALSVFISGTCKNMNGRTNVNLDNKYLVFDVDRRSMDEALFPAFLHIAYEFAYSIAKRDLLEYVAVIMDEVWRMMRQTESAKMVQEMIKLIRGFGGCAVIATQESMELLSSDYGKSIINGTDINIVMNIKEEELERISQILHLNEKDKMNIRNFERGQALFISNGDKTPINIKVSQREQRIFTTDINLRRRFANECKEMKGQEKVE